MKKLIGILLALMLLISVVVCDKTIAQTVPQEAINLKQGRAMILVVAESEKDLYSGLVNFQQNFDFQIDVVALKEQGVSIKPEAIKEFIFENKDKYSYFVLDEYIPYGFLNSGSFMSDYFYAFEDQFFLYNKRMVKRFGGTVDRKPDIILSRIKRSQISFYEDIPKRMENISGLFALPKWMFNRDQYECGVGSYEVCLSYAGWFLKRKFSFIKPDIEITTLFDDLSSKPKGSDMLTRKPRMKPDLSLTRDNFIETEEKSNIIMFVNTFEPIVRDGEEGFTVYLQYFTSALWKDENKNGHAEEEEVKIENIAHVNEMNGEEQFKLFFIPTPNIMNPVLSPFIIHPANTVGDSREIRSTISYRPREDPEGSNPVTVWNAILSQIWYGKGFAEANLLGYKEYFDVLKEEEDPGSQAMIAPRLFYWGLPWYNIFDLKAQPSIQLEKNTYQSSSRFVEMPIKNTGDETLIINLKSRGDIKELFDIKIAPGKMEIIQIEKQFALWFFMSKWFRKPYTYETTIQLETNDLRRPTIEIEVKYKY